MSKPSATSKASISPSKVVSLPSMKHSLDHLPNMNAVGSEYLHYGPFGTSKEASQAKLQQTLQRRDTASTNGASSSSHQPPFYSAPPRKSNGCDDGEYLMMNKVNKGRKKPV